MSVKKDSVKMSFTASFVRSTVPAEYPATGIENEREKVVHQNPVVAVSFRHLLPRRSTSFLHAMGGSYTKISPKHWSRIQKRTAIRR